MLSSSASRKVEAPTELRDSQEVKPKSEVTEEVPAHESTVERCLREIKKYVNVLSITDAQVIDSTTQALRDQSSKEAIEKT